MCAGWPQIHNIPPQIPTDVTTGIDYNIWLKQLLKKQMEIKLPKLKDAEDTEELLNDFTTF